jgi:hypothetical protein
MSRRNPEGQLKGREHGKRADSIVKNMLLTARGVGEQRAADINALVRKLTGLSRRAGRKSLQHHPAGAIWMCRHG